MTRRLRGELRPAHIPFCPHNKDSDMSNLDQLVSQLCHTLMSKRYLKAEDTRLLSALQKWQRTKDFLNNSLQEEMEEIVGHTAKEILGGGLKIMTNSCDDSGA